MTEPELVMSNAYCGAGHPLYLVAEGYAYCVEKEEKYYPYAAWCLAVPNLPGWEKYGIRDDDWNLIKAWVSFNEFRTKDDVLAFIQEDIEAGRIKGDDWDEEAERARLVAI